ncbi:Retrovirus-related Pol polyprotein from transposon TNT 1-94 [Gossypium australe]|uniref:Retrovirus-related Pol polyprotein from transposon TNT 1-94 n=1 Tax=Gossypium australe TaxID=47621 RepID=A0A5B6VQA5_9ROSI|nr:Retrovirus-related Pol polyprotein from transposon TNT 1-94 [Gossypium australe]
MKEEIIMLEKNQTWKLVKRPEDRKFIEVTWIFKTKLNANDFINKHKAKLVAKQIRNHEIIVGYNYTKGLKSVLDRH